MNNPKLTESESRYLAHIVADEIRKICFSNRICKPQETRRCIRARVIKEIISMRAGVGSGFL